MQFLCRDTGQTGQNVKKNKVKSKSRVYKKTASRISLIIVSVIKKSTGVGTLRAHFTLTSFTSTHFKEESRSR